MMLLIEGITAGASCLIEPDVCSAHCYSFAKHFLASVCPHLEVLSSLCWGTHTGSSVPLSSWHTFTKLSSRASPPAIGRVPLGDLSVNSSGWISAYVSISWSSCSVKACLEVGSGELCHTQVKLRGKVTGSSLLLLEPCVLILLPFLYF